jgi:hypothetical protein
MAQLFDARNNEFQGDLDGINGITLTDARTAVNNLAAANAEVLVDIVGKSTVTFDVRCVVTLGTNDLVVEGTVDGTNYVTMPFWVQSSTIPSLAAETVNVAISPTAMAAGQLCVVTARCTGFRRMRLRKVSATGNANVALRASRADLRIIAQPQPGTCQTLLMSAVGPTALIAAPGAGLFQYLTALHVTMQCTTATVTAVSPPTLTLSNLPSFVINVHAIGAIGECRICYSQEFVTPIKASAANTVINATLSALPVNATYRLQTCHYIGG